MLKTKSNFIVGAIILVISNLITKAIGAIYRVPLLRTLGSEGLGQYQMILPIFALFLVISSSGIVVTLSKFVSKETEHKNSINAKKYLLSGIVISILASVFLSALLIVFAPNIAKYQKSSGLYISYIAIVPAIILGSLLSVFRGYFLGKRKMIFSGLAQVIEAISKLVFSLVLSTRFSVYGYTMAVFGALLGISISELVSFVFILIVYFLQKKKENNFILPKIFKTDEKNYSRFKRVEKLVDINVNISNVYHSKNRYITFFQALKNVFSFSFFVMLQSSIMPLINAIDSLIIVPLLLRAGIIQSVAYSLYGLENGVVSSILALPTVVASAVGASIIPNIKKDKSNINSTSKNIKNAFNIVWLSSIFCAFAFVIFSNDIINFLYGSGLAEKAINELSISADLLRINSFNLVYLCLLSISTSVLQGLERNKVPVINLATAGILRLFLMIVLLSKGRINIYGTAIADMAFYSFALILNLREIKKAINLKFGLANFAVLPVVCCVAVSLSMVLIKMLLKSLLTPRVLTLAVILCGCGVYLSLLIATKVIDLKNLSKTILKKRQIT